jgi:hypothetical protein
MAARDPGCVKTPMTVLFFGLTGGLAWDGLLSVPCAIKRRRFRLVLEDWTAEDNPVRVVDAFVDALDLGGARLRGIDAARPGRPGYHPSALLTRSRSP